MVKKRILEVIGILMIGDGLVAAAEPERHGRLWLAGPRLWRRAMKPFVESPRLMRWAGVGEAGLGLWLASRQRPG